MGILFCIGSNFKEVSKRFKNKEQVEYVNFDYDDEDEEILLLLKSLNKEILGANLRRLLSVDPYDDTLIGLDVIRKAYEELRSQIDTFKDKPYNNFLKKLLRLLSICVECNSTIVAIGD